MAGLSSSTSRLCRRPWVLVLACGLPAFGHPAAARSVVLLYPLAERGVAFAQLEGGLRNELDLAQSDSPIELRTEFLDLAGSADAQVLADYLAAKYADRAPNAVLAVGTDATRFLVDHGRAFEQVPRAYAVFEVSPYASDIPASSNAIIVPFRPALTVGLARALTPKLHNVFVVDDPARSGRARASGLRADLRSLEAELDIHYLADLPYAGILARVSQLPPDSMVLYDSFTDDGNGRPLLSGDVAQHLAETANAPVYGLHEGYIGRGVVGGYQVPFDEVGRQLAKQALRLMEHEPAPAVTTLAGRYVVDGRVLNRWGMAVARLPGATDERFAVPSIWTTSRDWIIALAVLAAVQFALIAALLLQSANRRRDRLALAEAAQRFRLARIAGQVGYWHWDVGSRRMTLELELREMLGYDANDEDTGSVDWRAHIHPDDLSSVLAAARSHAHGRTSYFEVQHRVLDRNNNVRWFLSRGQIVRDRTDHPIRLVGAAMDVTERKRAEDDRARAQRQLQEQRIDLAHLNRAAAMGALSGAFAHELNQPLTAMLSNAQAGREFLRKRDVDRQELGEIMLDIENDGRRAGEVIHRLRNLLHRSEETFEVIQVGSVIDDVLQLLHVDLMSRAVRVVLGPMKQLPPVLADRVQLQQVLLNLVMNASDAMSSVDPGERRIVISASAAPGNRVRVTVSDSGCGIAPGNAESIFKPFVTTKSSGLGIGLSISRSIVEAHGGRIWGENNPQRGAAFHLELPTMAKARIA